MKKILNIAVLFFSVLAVVAFFSYPVKADNSAAEEKRGCCNFIDRILSAIFCCRSNRDHIVVPKKSDEFVNLELTFIQGKHVLFGGNKLLLQNINTQTKLKKLKERIKGGLASDWRFSSAPNIQINDVTLRNVVMLADENLYELGTRANVHMSYTLPMDVYVVIPSVSTTYAPPASIKVSSFPTSRNVPSFPTSSIKMPSFSKKYTTIVFRVLMKLKDGTEEPLVADTNDQLTLKNVDSAIPGRDLRSKVRSALEGYMGSDTVRSIKDIKLKHKGYLMGEYETVSKLILRSEDYVPDVIYMTAHLSFPESWRKPNQNLRGQASYKNTYDPPVSYPSSINTTGVSPPPYSDFYPPPPYVA